MSGYQIASRTRIDGEFEGFDENVLFKLSDGTYWLQDEYKYWYHYAYCPEVLILKKGARHFIKVLGQDEFVAIRQVYDVLETKIHGDFKGWEGESIYRLANGQVWQQAEYKYEYKYAYRPDVLIFDNGYGLIMCVAETRVKVRRIQ